jgi:hypothetical protein
LLLPQTKLCITKQSVNDRLAAEEHLRVIRSLMERATVYRAISAPTALVGGFSALGASAWLFWRLAHPGISAASRVREFAGAWIVALLITVGANALFIWQEARRDRRPFFSPGLRLALRSVIPSFFVAAVITVAAVQNPNHGAASLAMSWIAFYGLALLATMNFAPRSLSMLGWGFVVFAAGWLGLVAGRLMPLDALNGDAGATLAMAVTFGLFHLVYAACTWPRGIAVPPALESE